MLKSSNELKIWSKSVSGFVNAFPNRTRYIEPVHARDVLSIYIPLHCYIHFTYQHNFHVDVGACKVAAFLCQNQNIKLNIALA